MNKRYVYGDIEFEIWMDEDYSMLHVTAYSYEATVSIASDGEYYIAFGNERDTKDDIEQAVNSACSMMYQRAVGGKRAAENLALMESFYGDLEDFPK